MRRFTKNLTALTLALALTLICAQGALAAPWGKSKEAHKSKSQASAKAYSDDDDDDFDDELFGIPECKYVQNQNDTFVLDYDVYYEDPKPAVTFTSSNDAILSVDSDGKVTVVGDISGYNTHDEIGYINIKAQGTGTKIGDGRCTVYKGVPLQSINVSPSMPTTIKAGEELRVSDYISFNPTTASCTLIDYYSFDNYDYDKSLYVADYSNNGVIRGITPGKFTLFIFSFDGAINKEINFTVTGTAVKTISMKEEKVTLKVGDTYTLTPTFKPANATNQRFHYTYFSIDKKGNYADGGLTVKGKQTPLTQSNTWYGMNEAKTKAFLQSASASVLKNALPYEIENILLACGMTEDQLYNIDDLDAYLTPAKLSALISKLDFTALCKYSTYFDYYRDGDSYSDGPLTIKADKEGLYYFMIEADGNYSDDYVTLLIIVEKADAKTDNTSTKIPAAQTGDNNLTPLFALLAMGSAAVATGTKRRKRNR